MWIRWKISLGLLIFIEFFELLVTTAAAIDICVSLCRCGNETGIEKIHCDFTEDKEYILGDDDGLTLSQKANSINITLGDDSKLEFKEGLFNGINRINSVSIQGLKVDFKNSNNHVVLQKNTFRGIRGSLPEISFKNLKRVTLQEKSLDEAFEIVLFMESIWKVTVEKEVFGTSSYNATFNDIADLNLNEEFLKTTEHRKRMLSVFINRCHITNFLSTRAAFLTELRIENSDVEIIKSKAFAIPEIGSLVINNVKIQAIEKNIFNEGTILQNMAVTNCKIGKIESKAIHSVGISSFIFENNSVQDIIDKDSIEFFGATIRMAHNTIHRMGADWFKATETSNLTIMNNTFGSFDGMILQGSSETTCIFYHNKFTTIEPESFKSITNNCPFRQMIFHENCHCKFSTWLESLFSKSINVKDIEAEAFCTLNSNDDLVKCLNGETVKFEQYYNQMCSKSTKRRNKLNCGKVKVNKIDAQFVDPKVLSDDIDWMDYIHYIIGAAIIILLLPCLCIIISKKKKTRRDDNYNTNNNFHQTDLMHLNQSEGPPSYEASLRSTKSFSNHDRIIIKQTLETMKQNQPEEKYEMVFNNTQRLLHEHLNEYEKVKIIGDIVQTIGECENCGEDFVAFTDILYKHLAPDTTTTLRNTTASHIQQQQPPLDDLYSEPVLPQNNANNNARKTNSEHIYAEPTVLTQQQTMIPLLLANNYSNPLDNNVNINNNNLYSEPIMHDAVTTVNVNTPAPTLGSFKPKVATPYAISQTIDQQPTTSKNLPDIVNREVAGPSGQQLNRITRSPTTNRKIPEYTVPSTSHKIPARVTQDNIEDWSDESMENSTSSNHSGGSNATVKIDELLDYSDK
ncbi:hypothetical protein PVAND_012892 [Polypedilum vanderplanki]|uniref:Right handed beta helix domain-containing protein n=1 Tax=Polypedilum vanderplanki TaxID=319348 RepID=A0A9J6CPS8_POLVA|nr:hypothetical protein PVAND_012892 [Polypedilum vanderplanki]